MKTINEITEIRTIDIKTLVWFDKANGNSYFAQRITLNFGLENETEFINPYQYGYDSYRFEAFILIAEKFNCKSENNFDSYKTIDKIGATVRENTYKNCKKSELKNI